MNNTLKVSSYLFLFSLLLTVSFTPLHAAEDESAPLKAEISSIENNQTNDAAKIEGSGSIITKMTVITIIALLPFGVMLLTSFIKNCYRPFSVAQRTRSAAGSS